MQYSKIIDLSHALFVGKENRKLEKSAVLVDMRGPKSTTSTIPIDGLANIPIPEGQYFLMHELEINNHAGTHIELPSHCLKDGADLAHTPLELLVGEAVFLNLDDGDTSTEVGADRIKKAAEGAGGIRAGDICFCQFGWDKYFRTDKYMISPYFALDAIEWLVAQKIKLFGADIGLIERPGNPVHDNHLVLFKQNVSVIENLAHLDQVDGNRAFVLVLPVNIDGLDSMPVRIVALQ